MQPQICEQFTQICVSRAQNYRLFMQMYSFVILLQENDAHILTAALN